jgi:hypothetical protein
MTPLDANRRLTGDHNQCPTCREYFNSTAAFERHRAGSFENLKTGESAMRYCLTVDQMREKGMTVNAGGWWVTALNPQFQEPA